MKIYSTILAAPLLFCAVSGAQAQQEKAYIRINEPTTAQPVQPGEIDPVTPFIINASPGAWRANETIFFPVELTPAIEASVHAVDLPSGLSYNAGVNGIVGQTHAGNPPYKQNFTIHAASADYSTSRDFEISIYPNLLVSYPALVSGVVGEPLNIAPDVSGLVGMPRWIPGNAGALPAGISVAEGTGAITGIPTRPGNYLGLTVNLTDGADGETVASTVAVDIAAPPIVITAVDSFTHRKGVELNIPVTVTGGYGLVSLISSTFPPGIYYEDGFIRGAYMVGTERFQFTFGNEYGSTSKSMTVTMTP